MSRASLSATTRLGPPAAMAPATQGPATTNVTGSARSRTPYAPTPLQPASPGLFDHGGRGYDRHALMGFAAVGVLALMVLRVL